MLVKRGHAREAKLILIFYGKKNTFLSSEKPFIGIWSK